MRITLTNVKNKLLEKSINLTTDIGIEQLNTLLSSTYYCLGFSYSHINDELTIDVSDSMDLSELGEVVNNDSPLG